MVLSPPTGPRRRQPQFRRTGPVCDAGLWRQVGQSVSDSPFVAARLQLPRCVTRSDGGGRIQRLADTLTRPVTGIATRREGDSCILSAYVHLPCIQYASDRHWGVGRWGRLPGSYF